MSGPLAGMRVVEMAGIGPGPFCAMLLADLGAEVVRVRRPGGTMFDTEPRFDVTARGCRFVDLDLRKSDAVASALALIEKAEVLIEGYRPGVMERLGLGPAICLDRNPRLVYGRMTGWGQDGPLAQRAGHDINYIALTGALHAIGRADSPPPPPLNLVGDFGGGAMFLAFGIMAALLEARASGNGQVVDAAMVDGAALLAAGRYAGLASGRQTTARGSNLLDGGAPFYDTYACADGKFIALGAIEPQFYARFRQLCDLTDPLFDEQMNKAKWPEQKQRLMAMFLTRSRGDWIALLGGEDTCIAPVLDWDEAPADPHNVERKTFVTIDDVIQPAPAPRFSRTPTALPRSARVSGGDTREVLLGWGLSPSIIDQLVAARQRLAGRLR
ncbi:CaiB/BaiF CoA-transferase family protein [Bradyrhizobium jicamae]|uniref:CaiB/BaiF CoA transferase family protein n=1 Tax=Bradyrhizobium jicamae TaxID=280332 RepID=UPI001BA49CF3|nr:CaiB/BaiF CoA-transferase family protein [Bradyrhizobium jicamae]MBR0934293.1 CoA transferase [Bradyrhizobium jicamae]